MLPQPTSDGNHQTEHPLTEMLNLHRFVFCSGCLIGTVITSLATCLKEENLTARDYAIVSGIGCTGRSSGCDCRQLRHAKGCRTYSRKVRPQ